MDFNYKNFFELKKMKLDELELYYKELRKFEYITGKNNEYIELKKRINSIIILLLKMDRIIAKRSVNIIGDKSIKTSKPKIYAPTHVGRYDIETATEVAKENTFLLMGDPGETYRDLDGLILKMKGVIFVDTKDKEDRRIAKEKCIKVLNKGGNILIFPEGAWNITENQLVMKLFDGAVDMARQTGAEIIPIGIEKYDNSYFVNIGTNISIEKDNPLTNKELSSGLRDVLATLKWEILEKFPSTAREEISNDYSKKFLNDIMSETEGGYTVEEIIRTSYKDKNIVLPEEAFAFLNDLNINNNNSFLFNKNFVKQKKFNNI